MSRFRPKLTYANVMSSIAVFAVLGGGAYAGIDRKIRSGDIAKNAVKTKQLAPTSVKPRQLARNSVRRPKLPAGVIGPGKIANEAVITDKIGDLAVETDKIAPLAVGTGKIADLAVGTEKIAGEAVSTDKLAEGAVEHGKIGTGAVTTEKLHPFIAGVALAGVHVSAAGAVVSSFNRFGGAPTVQPVAAGIKGITFPGLSLNFPDFVHQATINGGSTGFIRVRSPLGANAQDVEVRTHNATPSLANRAFSYNVYATP